MQPSPQPLEKGLQVLRAMHFVLSVSILLYVWIGESFFSHRTGPLDPRVALGMGACAVGLVSLAFLVRKRSVGRAIEVLRIRPDDASALNQWRTGSLSSFVLAESVALAGFVLRIEGGTLGQAACFYAAAIALMVLWWPNRP